MLDETEEIVDSVVEHSPDELGRPFRFEQVELLQLEVQYEENADPDEDPQEL